MQPTNSKQRIVATLAFIIVLVGLAAFSPAGYQVPGKDKTLGGDTVPARKKIKEKWEYKMGDLDKALKELDMAMENIDKTAHMDFDHLNREIKAAMEEVKRIDVDQINHEVDIALKEVDWTKIKSEVDRSLRLAMDGLDEVDKKELKEEMKHAEKDIKEEKLKSHVYMKDMKENLDKSLLKARLGIEKAKQELTMLKEFTGSLEKEGLINKKKGYKIEIRNDEMYINGTKQSKEVNERYRKYFKDKDYSIVSDGDSISAI